MKEFSWTLPEHNNHERSNDWFWGLGLASLIGVVASIYFSNYLLAILIVIAAFSLILFALKPPRHVSYSVSDKGFRVDDTLYPFKTLDSFWIEESYGDPRILIVSKKFFMPYIVAPLGDHEPEKVRGFLLEHLPEVEHHEPIIQIIAERFGL